VEAEKSGKLKVTVELEVNPALMELVRTNIDAMSQIVANGMPYWRERMKMGQGGKGGHGMGVMMHHGQE